MSEVKIACVIPARMGSSRFPGKPLLEVQGIPMVEHVRRRALLCPDFSSVVVATCDEEISRAIKGYGGDVVMTSSSHPGATDRVAEAAGKMECTHVVNLQGDEILVLPEDLKAMATQIKKAPKGPAWNAIAPINDSGDMKDPSIVKCVVSQSDRIMYCTRDFSTLPVTKALNPVRIILGILGFEISFLKNFRTVGRTPAEQIEGIDQNRIIENDIQLQGVPFSKGYPGVNSPPEVEIVNQFLKTDPRQKNLLREVLAMTKTSLAK